MRARPALTVLGIDCPAIVGSSAAIQPSARARLNLRIPPGTQPAEIEHMSLAEALFLATYGAA
jgi:cysteinylglycine-S-conjugate dipeptidase